MEQQGDGGSEGPQLRLQRALLPGRLPEVDGLPVTARYFPAGDPDHVGGDWYDVIRVDGGAVALVVGDVAGADLVAAALTAQLRGAVRAYALEGHPPAVVVTRTNEFHLGLETGRLVTMAYALVHPGERIVTVVRAGHLPPVLTSPGGAPCLLDGAGGPPLGVRSGEVWREVTTQVEAGSALVLYTDGLLRDGGVLGTDDGLRRLLDAIGTDPVTGPDELAARLAELVDDPPPDDTVLLVGHLVGPGPDGSTLRRTLPPTAESASVARWLVNDLLKNQVDDDTRDTAALLTTELVSNAIRHTRDELVVSVRLAGGTLRVGVADSSHRRPQLVQVGRRDTSGRGLHLVEAMADRWGVDPDERGLGKTVWFELGTAAGG
ncbi:MAG TPA: ATP-binding SpoIIE family protein phosphatase [Mycobacteriales bacterium]|nr:ATP-binding SpoIIE family protein phosphatase [Mycobacteriales bacterium]